MKKIYVFLIISLLIMDNYAQVNIRLSESNKFANFHIGYKPWVAQPYYGSRGTYFADASGDGKADAIVVNDGGVYVRTSNGSQFSNLIGNKLLIAEPYYGNKGTYFADVNGNGTSDAIVVNDDKITVRLSDGTKFLDNASWTSDPYYGSRGTYFADVNGDAKADAIVVNDDKVIVRISDGTKFLDNVSWTTGPYYGTRGTYFADVNGDAKADAIVVNDDKVTVRISDGTKFLDNVSWTSGPYYGTRGTYFADVNGDSKADAIVVNNDRVTVRISDGMKFLDNASWTSGPFYGTRGTYFADVNGDRKADIVTLTGPPIMITRRIAGVKYFTQDRPDNRDGYSANNGFLLVVHNPGCGIIGNNGNDKFFQAAGKPLPPECEVVNTEFAQFWPTVREYDNPWGGGSYDANLNQPNKTVRWHNACTGRYSGKNLYYLVSFTISMPEGTDLGEPTFVPQSSIFRNFQLPAQYGWTEPSATTSTTPPTTGSLTASFVFTNVPGTQQTSVNVTFIGTLLTPKGNTGDDKFTFTVSSKKLVPGTVAQPAIADIRNLRAGTWRVIAQPSGIAGPVQCTYEIINGTNYRSIYPDRPVGSQCQ